MKLTLEKRKTDPRKLGGLALGAAFTAVVLVLFVAPLVARIDAANVSSGEYVEMIVPRSDGVEMRDRGTVELVDERFLHIRDHGGNLVKVPHGAAREL